MGALELKMPVIERKYLYVVSAIAGVVILFLVIWFARLERLPGYDTEPTLKGSYIEPGGAVSEFFTGFIKKTEISIKGPKMTVKMDVNNSDRTFFVPRDAPVWLGLMIGDKNITGEEKISFTELKVGWRVAIFIGNANEARRVNVLKRVKSEE